MQKNNKQSSPKKAFLVVLESKNLSSSLDMWAWVWPHLKQATRTNYVRVHKDTTNRILICTYSCFSGKELIVFYQTSPIYYIHLIIKLHQKSTHKQHKNTQKVKRDHFWQNALLAQMSQHGSRFLGLSVTVSKGDVELVVGKKCGFRSNRSPAQPHLIRTANRHFCSLVQMSTNQSHAYL